MRIQLNKDQAKGLFDIIEYLLIKYPYADRKEKLLDVLVNEIRIKLRNKLETRNTTQWSIILNEAQALAFEEWVLQQRSCIPPMTFIYELNEVTKVTNLIDLTYG